MSNINVTLYGKEGDVQYGYSPATTAEQVSMDSESGEESNVSAEIAELRSRISSFGSAGVMFKGALTSSNVLPTVAYRAGWQYIVQEAGTFAGNVCEAGDFIVCVKDYASGTASDADWAVLQVNVVGAVTGPSSAVSERVAVFDGTSGKVVKDSGFTLGKSVPANAVFSDTTYSNATSSSSGLMSAEDKTKLSDIEASADVTDATSVAAAGAFMKASDTADDIVEGATKKMLTSTERDKLSGIDAGAEENQNAFSIVKVGTTTVSADSKTDTLEIVGGDGITLTADAANDKVTVATTYVDACIVSSLQNVPSNLRSGGLIVLKN